MDKATVKTSRYSYRDTVARLLEAIDDAGSTVFANIDQAEAARSVGLTLRPTSLIIFGNPKGGTPLMHAFPLIGLDLPLKAMVWEEDGAVRVGYVSASEIAARYHVTQMDAQIAALDRGLDALISSVTES
jgi:uncharacterized protein (DUF302 family)